MPFLDNITLGAVDPSDTQKQTDSMVQQLNEWAKTISNEKRTEVYKDNSGKNRIIIGVLPDGTTGIVISKEGFDVLSVFT